MIPNLPPKCVLVVDNAAYHNVQVDRRLVRATKTHLTHEWLTKHRIQWSAGLLKDELLELCRIHPQEPVYVMDLMLSQHGHLALRFPPYHADLNPIELIWANLKGNSICICFYFSSLVFASNRRYWNKCSSYMYLFLSKMIAKLKGTKTFVATRKRPLPNKTTKQVS